MIRIVTWNQEANDTPTPEELTKILFPCRRYHIIAVGTQECENSFTKSIISPSKVKWEATLEEALGMDYDVVRSHSLQALHVILFAHKSIGHLLSNVRSRAVPTGIGDTLGNKGGIGIAVTIGESTFLFVNMHLSAHQHSTERRTREFYKICHELSTRIWKRNSETMSVVSTSGSSSANNGDEEWTHRDRGDSHINDEDEDEIHENLLDDGDILRDTIDLVPLLHPDTQHADNDDIQQPTTNPLVHAFDRIFLFGDLNFRINGTREVIDGMLEYHMHDALLCNDQLTMLLHFNPIFVGFHEGPLNFFPTYKFDHNSGERIFFFIMLKCNYRERVVLIACKRPRTHRYASAISQITTIPHTSVVCHHGPIEFYSKQTNGRKWFHIAAPPMFERPIIDQCMLPFDRTSNSTMRVVRNTKFPNGKVEERREVKSVAYHELK